MKILLMESDNLTLERLSEYLKGKGHDVFGCRNSQLAIDLWQQNRCLFDLVITECSFGGGLGFELISFLRTEKTATRVMITTSINPVRLLAEHPELSEIPVLGKTFGMDQFADFFDRFMHGELGSGLLTPDEEKVVPEYLPCPRAVAHNFPDQGDQSVAKKRILLMEDEQAVSDITVRMLQKLGYEVVACANLQEAKQAFAVGSFDLVLTDKDEDIGEKQTREYGVDLIEHIRSNCPDLPVVLMTGDLVEEARKKLEHIEQLFFIQKPFKLSALQEVLEETMKKKPKVVVIDPRSLWNRCRQPAGPRPCQRGAGGRFFPAAGS